MNANYPTTAEEVLSSAYSSRLSAAGTLRNHRQRLEQTLARVGPGAGPRQALQAEKERLEAVITVLVEARERLITEAERRLLHQEETLQQELSILPDPSEQDLQRRLTQIRNQRIAGTSTAGLLDHD
ncbi:hypothetical protein [Synechococcus sp. 1G10]|uniref:hypothetical protein n=1 Tax=Synechococcus sp. 1G10 TaxID=2025605 RepID=UPI00117C39E0|nr:hypothetical protein [Synechococcus sp. 1G10]